MATALPLPQMVTRDSEMELNFRSLEAQFGDGVKQVASEGINPVFETWSITWAPLTLAQRNTVITFLRSVGTWGVVTWTPCDETVSRNFKLIAGQKAKFGRVNKSLYRISITLEEVFNV